MKNKGSVNIEISFPVISISKNYFSVVQTKEKLTICNNKFLEDFNKNRNNYKILDALGNLYSEIKVERLGYTNILLGFNLASASSTYFANIHLEKIKELSNSELKIFGLKILKSNDDFLSGTMLDIKRWKTELQDLNDKEDILRYLFYFADTSRYYNPDIKDLSWRERKGFVS